MEDVTHPAPEEREACPVRKVLVNLQGKWQLLILILLDERPRRFNELKREIGDISQRVLTETLRSLERDGYLTRTVATAAPLRVDYALTDLGHGAMAAMRPLVAWSQQAYPEVRAAREVYDARD